MQRHHRNAASRVGLGTLIVGIALSLMVGMPPAQAAAPVAAPVGAAAAATSTKQTATTPPGRPCGPGVNFRTAERRAATGPQQFSEGGCGFMQRCIHLNRSEQQYLISGSKWIVQAALCTGSIGIGCVAAGALVELAAQWLMNRGGICPTSKPKLRVRYLPSPGIEGCVA